VSGHLEAPLSCRWAQLTYKPDMGPRKKHWACGPRESLGPRLEPASTQTLPIRIHHSNRVVWLFGTPTISTWILSYQYKNPSWSHSTDMQTLRNSLLLCYIQLDSMISVIHASNYGARSSLRFKCCNAPISMQVVMNSESISTWRSYNQVVRFGRLQVTTRLWRADHAVMELRDICTHDDRSGGYK